MDLAIAHAIQGVRFHDQRFHADACNEGGVANNQVCLFCASLSLAVSLRLPCLSPSPSPSACLVFLPLPADT